MGARLVDRAAELAREDPATRSRVAHALAYVVGDVDGAFGFIERARKLKPNLPYTWYVSGWLKLWLGQPAMDHLTTALRLAPFHPLSFKTVFLLGDKRNCPRRRAPPRRPRFG